MCRYAGVVVCYMVFPDGVCMCMCARANVHVRNISSVCAKLVLCLQISLGLISHFNSQLKEMQSDGESRELTFLGRLNPTQSFDMVTDIFFLVSKYLYTQ